MSIFHLKLQFYICMEYGILMQIKRTFSKYQFSETDEFINRLQFSDLYADNSWIQSHLNNPNLQRYFSNLHKHITSRNLHHFKSYESLIDGLYILLKGQVKFMLDESYMEKSKLKKLKSSKTSLSTTTTIINATWSVFECTYKNCTATAETYVLRITQEQATQANFYQLFSIRNQLYSNRYLSQDHHRFYDIPKVQRPFYTSLKIHSHFSFKSYNFRQLISLQSPAIVFNGRAKLKVTREFCRQFDKYGVLLPNLKYEVSSAELSLMIIEDNQTLNYEFDLQFDKIRRLKQFNYVSSVYKTEICTPNYGQSIKTPQQKKNKIKDRYKVFKQTQQYSIISTFLCNKSLNFAKRHNIIHHTKQKKENRCKSPLILFDIVNQNSKISTPKFQSIHSINQIQTNTRYVSAHKVTSQSQCTQSNLLKKIKLSSVDCARLLKKSKKVFDLRNEASDSKHKTVFNLTLDKIQNQRQQQEANQYPLPKFN